MNTSVVRVYVLALATAATAAAESSVVNVQVSNQINSKAGIRTRACRL